MRNSAISSCGRSASANMRALSCVAAWRSMGSRKRSNSADAACHLGSLSAPLCRAAMGLKDANARERPKRSWSARGSSLRRSSTMPLRPATCSRRACKDCSARSTNLPPDQRSRQSCPVSSDKVFDHWTQTWAPRFRRCWTCRVGAH